MLMLSTVIEAVSPPRHRHDLQLIVLGGPNGVLPALLARLRRRDSRLLVWLDEPPPAWRLLARLALLLADGVLASNDAAAADAAARRGSGERVFAVPGPFDIAPYLAVPPTRSAAAAHRVVVRGGLTPEGDGLHVLYSAVRWAERHPQRCLELVWLGAGDLREVLRAQSLPENLRQCFMGVPSLPEQVALYAEAGLLIDAAPTRRPATVAREAAMLAEAMASGLVVLFDVGCRAAGRLLRDGLSGIGYDGAAPEGLERALAVALARPPAALNAMRGAARMRVLPMDPQGHAERLERAVATVTRGASAAGALVAAGPLAKPG